MGEIQQDTLVASRDTKPVHLQSWRLAVVIGSLCLGIFLLGLDQNIIGVAIPRITTEFRALDDIAWYGSAYLLTITAFQPFFGNLYKHFNAKVVYVVSLLIFEVGSIICASAKQSEVLIFGRAFLGLGAAGLLQGALAIIGYVVSLDKVPLFQGVVVSSLGVSVSIGPVLGGVLTERLDSNVPVGVAVIIAIVFFVRIQASSDQVNHDLPLKTKLRQMDAVGTVLFIGAVVSLLLVLQWGGQLYPWNSSRIIALLVVFGILVILFTLWEWKQGDTAIIPFRIMRKRSIHMGALVLFALGGSSLDYAYYLPIYFQSAQGVSTIQSGVRFISLVLPQIVGLVVVGAIVSQWGYYVPYMILGIVINSIGAGLLTTIGVSTPTVEWAAYMVINGLGIGMAQQLPYTALQAVLEPADVPIGNAISVFSYQLGGALSVGIGQNLLLSRLKTAVPQYTDAVSPQEVIAVGATGLAQIAPDGAVLSALRHAYAAAVRDPLILALALATLAFPFACGMERLNIKHIAQKRLDEKSDIEGNSARGDELQDSNVKI
ncbi:MFS general substrate transporter [Xylaria bambusicola]|uniref:MFS general substrate transporter n=1 Tax=Xylaria bambusicola TaxID=326684 RepID=UPI002007E211|nr:MFS general substrate transporter [Xylaria bambusicola]KAI0514350.1 MFS general substrate transporter [Xylaria bambusicola]